MANSLSLSESVSDPDPQYGYLLEPGDKKRSPQCSFYLCVEKVWKRGLSSTLCHFLDLIHN